MRHLTRHPLATDTLRAAAERAGRAPADRLPCPVCAAGLKGTNLERHVTEKHADAHAAQQAGAPVLVGVDRRFHRVLWAVALVWLGLLAAGVVLAPDQLADSKLRSTDDLSPAEVRTALGDLATSPLGLTVLGGLVAFVVLALALRAAAFRATVRVDADGVRLRHRLGTGSIRVPFPLTVEVGELFTRHSAGNTTSSGDVSVDVHEGRYLRLVHGRRSITVGCPHGTDVAKHWTGLTPGGRRRRWDVALAPGPFVALQYALAQHGALTAR